MAEVQDFLAESFDTFLSPATRGSKSSDQAYREALAVYDKQIDKQIEDWNDTVRESIMGALPAVQSER